MSHTATFTPRIYVASLSDYNAGRLYGVWVDLDADTDADTISDAVAAMLAGSREPGAEEWAIHDYEGFGHYRLHEYESWEKVARIAAMLAKHGYAFSAFAANDDSVLDSDDCEESFTDSYRGEWANMKEYAEELVGDCGWCGVSASVLEPIWSYLDFDYIASELEQGDYWTAPASGGVYVFSNY